MIKKPNELTNEKETYNVLIAGYPGIGKTQLGFSAPKPLLLNLDKGVKRVPAKYRKDIDDVDSYEELLNDIDKSDLSDYESIVIDTGGRLLEIMKGWAIRKNEKNGQTDGNLSLKGYGVVGAEFMRFINHIKYDLHKHCIVLFHARETQDGDTTKLRILVEGSAKENVWQPMDIGGFMEMRGQDRIITFANCERFFGKGAFGVQGTYIVPNPDTTGSNDFLSELFKKMDAYLKTDAQQGEETKAKYTELMAQVSPKIAEMTGENIEDVQHLLQNTKHILSSEKELKAQFMARLTEIGYKYNTQTKQYEKI